LPCAASFSFGEVGGFWGLVESFPATTVCGKPNQPWTMLRAADDTYVPWWVDGGIDEEEDEDDDDDGDYDDDCHDEPGW
jgi:hypothetical protein